MKPQQPESCKGCSLYGISTGFCLGSGDPKTAKVALQLEAPGNQELCWSVDEDEFQRRKQCYPDIEDWFLKRGQPVVGKAGSILFTWGLLPVQLHRKDLFIDNTIRCLYKGKTGPYPTGDLKKRAEAFCRKYDRWDEFSPTVSLTQIHPAAIAREPSPLPLMIKTFEKGKDFSHNERPLILCGGKAVSAWMGYGSTVQKWLGHYQQENEFARTMREKRREAGMAITIKEKKERKKKIFKNLREAMAHLIQHAVPYQYGDEGSQVGYDVSVKLTEEEFKEIAGLLALKERKSNEKTPRKRKEGDSGTSV